VGENHYEAFQLSFNTSLKVDFQGLRVTSDGSLMEVRELDERLGFGALIVQHLTDSRRGKNTQFPLADLFRQSLYERLAGYEDVNDAEPLSLDPTFRLIGSEKIWERGAALTARLQSFETEMLAQEKNFAGLAAINRELIAKVEAIDPPHRIVLDMDSNEISVYGRQEQSAYKGHFESTCYLSLLLHNREGDCLAVKLRRGNVHSAEGWEELLVPDIERQQQRGKEVVFGPTRPLPSRRSGCVDELPNHYPGCHEVNEGQKRPTELVIARSNTSEVFEFVEEPFHFLACLVLFSLIGDLCDTVRLTGDHGFHALIIKHLPNRIAVIGLVHDGCVQLGEGR
jgi:hypothetical protein